LTGSENEIDRPHGSCIYTCRGAAIPCRPCGGHQDGLP